MNNAELKSVLENLARPIAQSLGLTVWGLDMASSGRRLVVRLFLEGPEGVTVNQCARVSRSLSVALEVEDVIPGAFVLEVSSPGLDRRFFLPEQMAGFVGQDLEVVLHPQGAEERGRRIRGRLESLDGDAFTLRQGEESVVLSFDSARRVRLATEAPELGPTDRSKATAATKAQALARFQTPDGDGDQDGEEAKARPAGRKKRSKNTSRSSSRGKV